MAHLADKGKETLCLQKAGNSSWGEAPAYLSSGNRRLLETTRPHAPAPMSSPIPCERPHTKKQLTSPGSQKDPWYIPRIATIIINCVITNIQALRAFASLAVVLYHMNYSLIKGHHTDFQGVAIFFVISGFIMTYITLKDDRESNPASFMLHRLIRIVPLYWFSVFLLIGLSNLGLLNLAVTLPRIWGFLVNSPASLITWFASVFNIFAWASPGDLLRTLLFIPYKNINGDLQPLLGVGWTLNIEMYFYAIFSMMLYFGKTLAPLFSGVTVFVVWLIGKSLGETGSSWLTLYSSNYALYFAGGIIVYYIWKALEKIPDILFRRWVFAAIASISASTYIFSNVFYAKTALHAPLAILSAPCLVVLSALLTHSIGFGLKNKLVLLLGAASYPLYLEHTIVLEILRTPAEGSIPAMNYSTTISGVLIAMAACSAVAIGVHLKIELPSLNWLKKKLESKKSMT